MSHVEARPVVYETGLEEPGVENLLRLAATYEPEMPAPEGMEIRVTARLPERRFLALGWPLRVSRPTLALAGGVMAVAAVCWTQAPFSRAPLPESSTRSGARIALTAPASPPDAEAPAPKKSGVLEPANVSESEPPVSRSAGRPGRVRRRYRRLATWRPRRLRRPTVPSVRWSVETVSHEVERAVTPGWWITQNESTGDLEASPAALEVVSARQIPQSSSLSCGPPEPEAQAPTSSETTDPPAEPHGGTEENPNQ